MYKLVFCEWIHFSIFLWELFYPSYYVVGQSEIFNFFCKILIFWLCLIRGHELKWSAFTHSCIVEYLCTRCIQKQYSKSIAFFMVNSIKCKEMHLITESGYIKLVEQFNRNPTISVEGNFQSTIIVLCEWLDEANIMVSLFLDYLTVLYRFTLCRLIWPVT